MGGRSAGLASLSKEILISGEQESLSVHITNSRLLRGHFCWSNESALLFQFCSWDSERPLSLE